MMTAKEFANRVGWICPKCKTANNPDNAICWECPLPGTEPKDSDKTEADTKQLLTEICPVEKRRPRW